MGGTKNTAARSESQLGDVRSRREFLKRSTHKENCRKHTPGVRRNGESARR